MHQVGFAQPDTAVDEQRVVGAPGILADLHGGGACQLVGLAVDKAVEGEFRIQVAFVVYRRCARLVIVFRGIRRRNLLGAADIELDAGITC